MTPPVPLDEDTEETEVCDEVPPVVDDGEDSPVPVPVFAVLPALAALWWLLLIWLILAMILSLLLALDARTRFWDLEPVLLFRSAARAELSSSKMK